MKWNVVAIIAAVMLSSLAFAGDYPVTPVTFTGLAATDYRLASTPGDVACAPSASGDWNYQGAKLIEFRATRNAPIFGGPGDLIDGDSYFSTVIFDPIGRTNNANPEILNGVYDQTPNTALWRPRVFYKMPGRDCYNWNFIELNSILRIQEVAEPLPSPNSAGLTFVIGWNTPGMPSGNYINFNEFVGGTQGMGSTAIRYIAENPSFSTHRFKNSDFDLSQVYYWSATNPTHVGYEPAFTTERGTRWLSVDTTQVTAQFSRIVAEPEFYFYGSTNTTYLGQHYFTTLITDTIDRTLKNRKHTLAADQWPASLTDADTSIPTSPLRGTADQGTQKAKNLYRMGAGEISGFAVYQIIDNQGINAEYTGEQSFWVGSTPNAVAYDSASNIRALSVNRLSAQAYSLKLNGLNSNGFGIPLCTGDLTQPDNWGSCDIYGNGRTDSHRVQLKFLGSDWILSEMTAPLSSLPSATSAINGGQIQLAKESVYGIVNANQSISDGTYEFRLEDVTPGIGSDPNVALISVFLGGQYLGTAYVPESETYTLSFSGTGNHVKIHVYSAEPGFTLDQKWAEFGIYSDEITLKDGQRYNLVSSTDPDKNFKVSLLWKNRDYGTAGTSPAPDTLREAIIYNVDGFEDKLTQYSAIPFLNSQTVFWTGFTSATPIPTDGNGTYLPDYAVGLTYYSELVANEPYNMYVGTFNSYGPSSQESVTKLRAGEQEIDIIVPPLAAYQWHEFNATITCTEIGPFEIAADADYYGQMDEVREDNNANNFFAQCVSGTSTSTMGYSALAYSEYRAAIQPGDYACSPNANGDWRFSAKMVLIAVDSGFSLGGAGDQLSGDYSFQSVLLDPIGSTAISGVSGGPKFFWKVPGRDCYNWNYAPNNIDTIRFDAVGTAAVPGSIKFAYNENPSGLAGYIIVKEMVTDSLKAYMGVPIYVNSGSDMVRFKENDQGKVYYLIHGQPAWTAINVPPAYTTLRGITVPDVGYQSVPFTIASTPVPAQSTAIQAMTATSYRASTTSGDVACSNAGGDWTFESRMVKLSVEEPLKLGGANDYLSGDYYFQEVFYDPLNPGSIDGTISPGAKLFWKVPGRDCFNWNPAPNNYDAVRFEGAGNGATAGAFRFVYNEPPPVDADSRVTIEDGQIVLVEIAASGLKGYTYLPLYYNMGGSSMRFKTGSDGTLQYLAPGGFTIKTVEVPPVFSTERGITFTDIGLTSIPFSVGPLPGGNSTNNSTTEICPYKQPIYDIDCSDEKATIASASIRPRVDSYVDEKGCKHVCKEVKEIKCPEVSKPVCKAGQEVVESKDKSGCAVLECKDAKVECKEPVKPVCRADEEAYAYKDDNSCEAFGCKAKSVECKTPTKPICSAGSEVYEYKDKSGCAAYGCQSVCPKAEMPACKEGYEVYSTADSKGCVAYGCKEVKTSCAEVKEPTCSKGQEVYKYSDEKGCTAYSCIAEGSVINEKISPASVDDEDSIANSMADTSGNFYAKVMGILGVQVSTYSQN